MGATLDKRKVDHELTLINFFYCFTGDSIILKEKITLVVEMITPPLIDHHLMEILVVDHCSAHHGILGRQTLKELWVVTSIHHLYMKFSTENGIPTVRSDQMRAREC